MVAHDTSFEFCSVVTISISLIPCEKLTGTANYSNWVVALHLYSLPFPTSSPNIRPFPPVSRFGPKPNKCIPMMSIVSSVITTLMNAKLENMVLALATLPSNLYVLHNQISLGQMVPTYDMVHEQLLCILTPHAGDSSTLVSHSSTRGGRSGGHGGHRLPCCNYCN
uniref:Uncharacterized protein n=1 Tax=Cajanus cajan TaxID=3821 RepID=A0A151R371_CAJCA|nr:hypothetical protein KK1_041867 [Cajanus cajan]